MSETKTFLALFADIDPAVDAIDRLRERGVRDDQMNVISGIPLTDRILGRPRVWTNVPRLALGGAVAGLMLGLFLSFGITYLYPLKIGRQGIFNGAPTVVLIFEMTMLGLLASTFIGVFLDSHFPSYRPKEYIPEISDGKIAILYSVPEEKESDVTEVLNLLGAESITPAERHKL
ncbi:MAG: quinol:electron acceptor oxidoreductase subunit ActD [Acidobacteriaceae bacterium]